MNVSKDILLAMNLQNSFLDKAGTIYMGEKAEILKVRLVDYLATYKGKKLFFREIHAMQDNFFVNDKTHSVATTPDCVIHPMLKNLATTFMDHTRYDPFYKTDLDTHLKKEKVESVTLVGLETHTSVLFAAESLRNRGYAVTVIEPCCMSRGDYMHDYAVTLMANFLGVRIGS